MGTISLNNYRWEKHALGYITAFCDPKRPYFDPSRIFQLVSYTRAGLDAASGPVVINSLFWSRMNKIGALAGTMTGTLSVIIWKGLLPTMAVSFVI